MSPVPPALHTVVQLRRFESWCWHQATLVQFPCVYNLDFADTETWRLKLLNTYQGVLREIISTRAVLIEINPRKLYITVKRTKWRLK